MSQSKKYWKVYELYQLCSGELDFCYYTVFEYQPVKIIKHVYEVARVQLADGNFEPTMDCPNIVDRCPFSARMFAKFCLGNMSIICLSTR